jgi:glycosyltransferase involved in cell wall biosynthesis
VTRVAVFIPVWNRASTLARAIDSALSQSPHEILVIDDASTDGSAEVAESYGPPVRVVRHSQKTDDHIKALSPAIESLDCDYVIGMGADDVLCDGFLQNIRDVVDVRKSRGWPGVVFGDYALLREGDPLQAIDVRRFGMPGVTFMSPSEARAWFRSSPAGRNECGVGSAIRKDMLLWLQEQEWWRLGPRSDAIGYVVAAIRCGCIYVPEVFGGFTVEQERPSYHQQVFADEARRQQLFIQVKLWIERPAVAQLVGGVEFSI